MPAKNTPGPWAFDNDGHITAATGAKESIANCYMHIVYRSSDEQAQANAHLIAAAPELLEKLQNVLSLFDLAADWDLLTAEQAEEIEAARAAIAKAEGR